MKVEKGQNISQVISEAEPSDYSCVELVRSYILETPGCFLLYVGGTYTLPHLWCHTLSSDYRKIKTPFRHISLVHYDL